MNQRTAKQIRRATRDRQNYKRGKKLWNKIPRTQRHAERQGMV